jgi:hypothetical protein
VYRVGLTLLVDVITILILVLRVLLSGAELDVLNVQSAYLVVVLSVPILLLLFKIVSVNNAALTAHVLCMEKVRFHLAESILKGRRSADVYLTEIQRKQNTLELLDRAIRKVEVEFTPLSILTIPVTQSFVTQIASVLLASAATAFGAYLQDALQGVKQ